MKPKTDREKILLMLAPPVLIGLFYLWKLPQIEGNRAAAERALQAAQKEQPVAAQVAAAHTALAKANNEMAALDEATRASQEQWSELEGARSSGSQARIRAIEGLTLILKENNLQLIDASPEEGTDAKKLPPALEQVAKALGTNQSGGSVQLWNVQFVGRYEDLVRALEALADDEPFAIPVHLKMEEAKLGTDLRRWTLVLWI